MGARVGTLWRNGAAAETAETLSEKTVVELLATEPGTVPGGKNFSPSNLKNTNASPSPQKERRQAQKSDPKGRETLLQGRKEWPGPAEGGQKAAQAPPLNRGYDDDEKIQEW